MAEIGVPMTTKAKRASRSFLLDAADAGDSEAVFQSIREGNNPNFSSDNGWTPLMLAAMHSLPKVVKLLLENGADPNFVTGSQENLRRSPLAVAVSNGQVEVVEMLLAYHADAEQTDASGMTALDLARKLAQRPFRQEAMHRIVSLLTRHQQQDSARTEPEMLTTSAA